MLNELGVNGILVDLLLTSVRSYSSKNIEQDLLMWIIITLLSSTIQQMSEVLSKLYPLVETVHLDNVQNHKEWFSETMWECIWVKRGLSKNDHYQKFKRCNVTLK